MTRSAGFLLLQCMKVIQRTTEVISVSLSKNVVEKMDWARRIRGQNRSSFISSLIQQIAEEERWQRIYRKGEKTARKFKITSEGDIERILHEA